jgi:hypothetical protein
MWALYRVITLNAFPDAAIATAHIDFIAVDVTMMLKLMRAKQLFEKAFNRVHD